MLDFVLNLLIFFIITAVFVKELGLNSCRRRGRRAARKETGSMLVVIRPSGEIWVDDRIVDIRAVRANVERLHAAKPDIGVLIVADKNAETGMVVQVIDQARQGGVENVSFGTSSR